MDSEDSDQTGRDAQADLSFRWAHMPFCWFCHDHDAAQIVSHKILICIKSLGVFVTCFIINVLPLFCVMFCVSFRIGKCAAIELYLCISFL